MFLKKPLSILAKYSKPNLTDVSERMHMARHLVTALKFTGMSFIEYLRA